MEATDLADFATAWRANCMEVSPERISLRYVGSHSIAMLGREVALVYEGAVAYRREVPVETAGLAPGVYAVRTEVAGRADASVHFTIVR